MLHHHGTNTVPEIVKSKNSLGSGFGTLVFRSHERPAKFYYMRQIIPYERIREMEHVGCGEMRLSVLLYHDIRTKYITIAAKHGLGLRIPYHNLLVWIVHEIKLIKVHFHSGAATGITE